MGGSPGTVFCIRARWVQFGAQSKGRVEQGVGYVKKNFLNGLDIPSFGALNPAGRLWIDTVANVRIHGETHCKPLERFGQEKPLLRPLPARSYDCAVVRPIGANGCCRVVHDTNRYTVPYLYASQKLTLKLYPEELLLYHQEKLIATHLRSYDRRQDIRNCVPSGNCAWRCAPLRRHQRFQSVA